MSSKKHKSKQRKQHSPRPSSPAELERAAEAAMLDGSYRKARDLFKALVKSDGERHIPRLVAANVALARQMLSNGQAAEAEQVMAYVRTLSPDSASAAFDLDLAMGKDDWTAVANAASAVLREDPDSMAAADALVAAGIRPEHEFRLPERTREALDGVLSAFEAISAQRYGDAREALRPIERSSVFSRWKIFLKGMIAFHTGDSARAAKFFAEASGDGAVGAAVRAFLPFCEETPTPTDDDPARVVAMCRVANEGAVGPVIARSDSLWRKGQHAAAYRALREGLADFPTDRPGLAGALTQFFANGPKVLGDHVKEKYLTALENLARRGTRTNNVERRMVCRLSASFYWGENHIVRHSWEEYLRLHEADYGVNPKLGSMIDCHLGGIFATEEGGDYGEPQMRQAEWARELLERSVARDADNLEAHLALLDLLERENATSERNTLLDRMSERFPDDKRVLMKAGLHCIARRAFRKGLGYLERAFSLDPLDPTTKRALALGTIDFAGDRYAKGKLSEGRATFTRLAALAIPPGSGDPALGAEYHAARQSVAEMLHGDADLAREKEREAFPEGRSEASVAFLMADMLLEDGAGESVVKPYRKRFEAATRREVTPAVMCEIVGLFDFLRLLTDEKPNQWALKSMNEAVRTAAKHPVPREDAKFVIQKLGPGDEVRPAVKAVVKARLREDADDPLFGFFKYSFTVRERPMPTEKDLRHIEALEEEARRRDDRDALSLITSDLAFVRQLMKFGKGGGFHALSDDGGPQLFHDDDLSFGDDPTFDDEYREMRETIAEMTESEFRKLRKKVAGKPEGLLFDEMRASVRGKREGAGGDRTRGDGGQIELF